MKLEDSFPNLREEPHRLTSPDSPKYNCIAWAAGDDSRWWWPGFGAYWPVEGAYLANLSTFREGFATLGFESTENPEFAQMGAT